MLKPDTTVGVTVDDRFLTVSWMPGPLVPGTEPESETGTWVLELPDREVPLHGAPAWPQKGDAHGDWSDVLAPYVREALRGTNQG